MNKFNILHLSNAYGSKKGGGIHEVVSNFYKCQKDQMHNPSIWYTGNADEHVQEDASSSILSLPTHDIGNISLLKCLFEKKSEKLKDFNIVHQHGIWTSLSLYSRRIMKESNLKVVIQPHGFLEPYRLNISKYKKKIAFLAFERSNLTNCASLIACSDDEGHKLKKMFPKQNIAVIYNGIERSFFNHTSLNDNKNKNKNKKQILFLSQIIPVKGIERLFHAISKIDKNLINGSEFIIAGYGSADYIYSLKSLALKLGIENFLKFPGPIFNKEKINAFDNSDFFILPTYSENYGIVVAESLARGTPVITTTGAPWDELNSTNSGLWVDNSEIGLQEALEKMLKMPQSELKNMGENARNLIRNKYLWDKTSIRTSQLYEWILFGGPKPDFIL